MYMYLPLATEHHKLVKSLINTGDIGTMNIIKDGQSTPEHNIITHHKALYYWMVTLTIGANFLNSSTQLGTVDNGAATKNGPLTPISMR